MILSLQAETTTMASRKKTRVSKTPLVTQKLQDSTDGGKLVIKTINMSLKGHLIFDAAQTLQTLNDYSKSAGIYRFIVGQFANFMILEQVTNDLPVHPLNKSFFDRCWSVIDGFKLGKDISQKFPTYEPFLRKFITDSGFTKDDLPPPVKYELRQSLTLEMAECSQRYIRESFFKRIFSLILSSLNEDKHLWKIIDRYLIGGDETSRKTILNRLAIVSVGCICSPKLKDSFELATWAETIRTYGLKDASRLLLDLIYQHRKLLKVPLSISKKSNKGFHYLLKKEPSLFYPYLIYCSRLFQERRTNYNNLIKVNKKEKQRIKDRIKKTFTDPKVRKKKYELLQKMCQQKIKYWKNDNVIWSAPFSILPQWSLNSAFLALNYTTMCTLFGSKNIDRENVSKGFFDLSTVSQLKRLKTPWKVLRLQTNGVKLNLQIQTGEAVANQSPNVPYLSKKGYDFPKKKQTIPWTTKRGVFQMEEKRYDNEEVSEEDSCSIKLHLVDPGVVNPVSVNDIKMSDCQNAQQVIDKGSLWSVSNKEFMNQSGRITVHGRNLLRRKKNKKYQQAINDLSTNSLYSCNLGKYIAGLRMIKTHWNTLVKESMQIGRKKLAWLGYKKQQSYLSRLANRIVEMDSPKRRTEPSTWRKLTIKERERLIQKVKQDRQQTKQHIVFFGDGNFSGGYGRPKIPKKKLVRELANRSLVFMLDEYNTSKCCPGCGKEMITSKSEKRIRCCTSKSNDADYVCPLWSEKKVFKIDRDYSATVNFAICAYQGLRFRKRPKFLSRTQTKLDKSISKIEKNL